MKPLLLMLVLLMGNYAAQSQIARKHLSKKHQDYYDSLMNMKYDHMFPVWADRVYKKGFDIPFPFGIMINNIYTKQDVIISNVQIGIKDADTALGPVDLSQVIQFGDVNAAVYNINLRADMWIFPFLNVYGLVSYIPWGRTSVEITKPISLTSAPEQTGWAYGVGIMGAGGVGPVWLQADYNATWADMQLLQNKVFTQVVGVRMGHVFPSKSGPEKNVSIWIGAMGIFINNDTRGEIALNDVFAGLPQAKIDEIKQSYNTWYDDLKPPQQKVVDKIVQKLQDRIDGISTDDVVITYQLDKKMAANWAGLAGAQYQFNKRWQLRAESQFIGKRVSGMLSVNYRFLGFRKLKK